MAVKINYRTLDNYFSPRSWARLLRDLRACTQIMRAYHIKKSATIVANPKKTRTAVFADELFTFFILIPEVVNDGTGEELGVEITAGAL